MKSVERIVDYCYEMVVIIVMEYVPFTIMALVIWKKEN
jgi:hypothetical protein